jgi:hypothetical protein
VVTDGNSPLLAHRRIVTVATNRRSAASVGVRYSARRACAGGIRVSRRVFTFFFLIEGLLGREVCCRLMPEVLEAAADDFNMERRAAFPSMLANAR